MGDKLLRRDYRVQGNLCVKLRGINFHFPVYLFSLNHIIKFPFIKKIRGVLQCVFRYSELITEVQLIGICSSSEERVAVLSAAAPILSHTSVSMSFPRELFIVFTHLNFCARACFQAKLGFNQFNRGSGAEVLLKFMRFIF